MAHVQGFTGSHWMSPSGKCLRRIAPTAAMVNEFFGTTQNTNKTQLLASNYSTFRALVISENFIPQCMNSFLTHIISRDRWLCFFGALYGSLLYPALRFDGACGLGVGGGVLRLWLLSTNHQQTKKLKTVTVFFSFAHRLKCICGKNKWFLSTAGQINIKKWQFFYL